MPTPPIPDFQMLMREQKRTNTGIGLPQAYRALVRGFIKAKTRLPEVEKEERKLQDACKTHL